MLIKMVSPNHLQIGLTHLGDGSDPSGATNMETILVAALNGKDQHGNPILYPHEALFARNMLDAIKHVRKVSGAPEPNFLVKYMRAGSDIPSEERVFASDADEARGMVREQHPDAGIMLVEILR